MKKILHITVLFAFVILNSCGNKTEDTSDKKTEKPNEQVKNDEKKVDTTVKKTESSGDSKGKDELGLNEGLPSNYPADIPKPNNSKCMGNLATSEGTAVTFESTETAKDIFEFFKDHMKKGGFELGEGGESLVSEQGGLIGWKKDNREVGLMVTFDKEQKKSQIVVTYK